MADSSHAKPQLDRQCANPHDAKEVSSSAKSPIQGKKQQKDAVNESIEKEKQTKNKDSFQKARPSPKKPPLPPRPAGHNPGKICTPTKHHGTGPHAPLHHERAKSPPNKDPSSPKPSRPPNPSIKREKMKSPEITRSPKMEAKNEIGKPQENRDKKVKNHDVKEPNNVNEARSRNQKKAERPPRPVGSPPPVEIIEKIEQAENEKSSAVKPEKPVRTTSIKHDETKQSHDDVFENNEKVSDKVRPNKQKTLERQSHVSDTQDTSKGLPKLNRPPRPCGPTPDTPTQAHGDFKPNRVHKDESKQEKPSRPSLPSQRSLSDSSKSRESTRLSKQTHHPPPVANKPERGNRSKQQNEGNHGEQSQDETQTVERRTDRKPVKFRVHSFSKTEVESFNSDMFNIKKLDNGDTKEPGRPSKPPPPTLPKPYHGRPSPSQFKKTGANDDAKPRDVKNKVTHTQASQDTAVVASPKEVERASPKQDKVKGKGIGETSQDTCEHEGEDLDSGTSEVVVDQAFDVETYLTGERVVEKKNTTVSGASSESEETVVHKYDTLNLYVKDVDGNGDKVKSKESDKVEKGEVKQDEMGESVLRDSKIPTEEQGMSECEVEERVKSPPSEEQEHESNSDIQKKKPAVPRPPKPTRTTSIQHDVDHSNHHVVVQSNDTIIEGEKKLEKTKSSKPDRTSSIKHDSDHDGDHTMVGTEVPAHGTTPEPSAGTKLKDKPSMRTPPVRPAPYHVTKESDLALETENKSEVKSTEKPSKPPLPHITRESDKQVEVSDEVKVGQKPASPRITRKSEVVIETDKQSEVEFSEKPTKPAPPKITKEPRETDKQSEVKSTEKPTKPTPPQITKEPRETDKQYETKSTEKPTKPAPPQITEEPHETDKEYEAKSTEKPTEPAPSHITKEPHETDKQSEVKSTEKPTKPPPPQITKEPHETEKQSEVKSTEIPAEPSPPQMNKEPHDTDKQFEVKSTEKPTKPPQPDITGKTVHSTVSGTQSDISEVQSSQKPKKPPSPLVTTNLDHTVTNKEHELTEEVKSTQKPVKPPSPLITMKSHHASTDKEPESGEVVKSTQKPPKPPSPYHTVTNKDSELGDEIKDSREPSTLPPDVPVSPHVTKKSGETVTQHDDGKSTQKPSKPAPPNLTRTSEHIDTEVHSRLSDEANKKPAKPASPNIARKSEKHDTGEVTQKPDKPAPPHIRKAEHDTEQQAGLPEEVKQKSAKPASPNIARKSEKHDTGEVTQKPDKPAPPHIRKAEHHTEHQAGLHDEVKQKPAKPASPNIARKSEKHDAGELTQKPDKPAPPHIRKAEHDTEQQAGLSDENKPDQHHKPDKPDPPNITRKSDDVTEKQAGLSDEDRAILTVEKPPPPHTTSSHSGATSEGEVNASKKIKRQAPPEPTSPAVAKKSDDSQAENLKAEKRDQDTSDQDNVEHVKKVVKRIEIDDETKNDQPSCKEISTNVETVKDTEFGAEIVQVNEEGHEVKGDFQNLGLLRKMRTVSVEIQLEESNGDGGSSVSEEGKSEGSLGSSEVLSTEDDIIMAAQVEDRQTTEGTLGHEGTFQGALGSVEGKQGEPHKTSVSQDLAPKVESGGNVAVIGARVITGDLNSPEAESVQEPVAKMVSSETSPKKKPPPKPKRTSSLKKESRPIVKVVEDRTEESLGTNGDSVMSCESVPEESPVSPKVTFQTESEDNSRDLVRSNSFSSSTKGRKDTASDVKETGRSDVDRVRMERSRSFGGRMKKKRTQPARPSPPTFFVENTASPDDTVEDSEKLVSGEADSVVPESTKLDSLEESQVSSKHDSILSETSSKHDSLTENTTDTDSDSDKEDVPQKSKTYYISREILSTERTFVDALKLVSEDFSEAVKQGNKKFGRPVIPEQTLQEIVLNINQIYDFDRQFLKSLEDRMESWEGNERIGDIIKTFSPFLKMYKTYIQGYDSAMAVLSDSLKKYPQFAEVVKEFACSERCQNLTVGMYMLKPIQRIPSYRLLLIDYLKHLSTDSLDYKDVSDALAIVSDVATHINEDMKRVDNFEAVLKVQRSLVGQVEIVKPGRELIKEGLLMKLSRKEMQARMFYLFTDMLLYTTPVANNQFSLNLSLPLGEIQVEIPVSPDFDNEFSIISTKKSFTLSASTIEERDEWLEALRNALDEIRKKKMTYQLAKKEKMDALMEKLQENTDKEAKLGSKAPVWIPDIRASMCMLCTDNFTMANRRHHCRACGKVICGSCSSNSAPLQYLNSEAARVCDNCYDELTETTNTPAVTKSASAEQIENIGEADSPSSRVAALQKVNDNRSFRLKHKQKKFGKKEVPAAEESTISGYLLSRDRKGKRWHKRWHVVKDNVLYVSKATSDIVALETCPLLGYEIRGPDKMDGDSKKIVFQLIHAGTPPVVLQTDNIKSAERWVNALRRATLLPH